jgi:hypothetical protein
VTQDPNAITFVTQQTECRLDCTPTGVCEQRVATCTLPQLDPGDYTVIVPGLPTRTLTIEAGAPTSCQL